MNVDALLHQKGHNSLDGMHAVFGFVKYHGAVALEDFVGNFHFGDAELCAHVLADGGVEIVESGEAMHEDALGACVIHKSLVHLIGMEFLDAFCPNGIGFAHGYPNVGIDNICALGAFHGIFAELQSGAGFLGRINISVTDTSIYLL